MNVYGGMTSLKHSINRRDPLHGDFQLEDKAKFRSIFEIFHEWRCFIGGCHSPLLSDRITRRFGVCATC